MWAETGSASGTKRLFPWHGHFCTCHFQQVGLLHSFAFAFVAGHHAACAFCGCCSRELARPNFGLETVKRHPGGRCGGVAGCGQHPGFPCRSLLRVGASMMEAPSSQSAPAQSDGKRIKLGVDVLGCCTRLAGDAQRFCWRLAGVIDHFMASAMDMDFCCG